MSLSRCTISAAECPGGPGFGPGHSRSAFQDLGVVGAAAARYLRAYVNRTRVATWTVRPSNPAVDRTAGSHSLDGCSAWALGIKRLRRTPMPPRIRLFYSGLIAVLLLIPALALYRELSRRPDIWWTPAAMALSLPAAQDRVEIYVRGTPLGTLVDRKQLWLIDQAGRSAIGAQDIGLRFNNWERIRGGRVPLLLFYAAACGAGVVLLVLVATGRLAYRGEHGMVAA